MKTRKNWAARLPAVLPKLLAAAAAAAIAPSAMALKVDMYAIGDFVPSASGGCGGGDRPSWPGMAKAWYDWMGLMGHTKTGNFTDGSTTLRRFCDPSYDANCADSAYVDWPDAAIIALHGFTSDGGWGGTMRQPWSAATGGNGECSLNMGGNSPNMFVGDNNLRFLHASSCLSLNDSYFSKMRQSMMKTPGSGRALHVFTGFHGLMWISSSYNGDYAETAIDGHSMSVAKAWVTNHYKNNKFECAWYDPLGIFGTCSDQCPTAMTIGPTAASALNRLNNERYNSGWGDPTGRNYYAWMGYLGCDPVGAGPFAP
ncbi:MAG: hypothetical protein EPO12_16815 [Aquabacterium sp.]|jgi:hypothetical protein|nr:MAG: hypothetical protein EPO12_16815 [Aquabacterium sp.]